MALDPILWSMKDAPTANVEEWAVLTLMGEAAEDDGCNAFKSHPTVGRMSRLDAQTVADRVKAMEKRGLIKRGDQRAAAYIPKGNRPVVYDLMIPYSWFPNPDRINEYRKQRGRGPITPENRPDLPPAPPKKVRADAGKPRKKKPEPAPEEAPEGGHLQDGGGLQDGGYLQDPPVYETGEGYLQDPDPPSTRYPTNAFNPPLNPPPPPGATGLPPEEGGAVSEDETPEVTLAKDFVDDLPRKNGRGPGKRQHAELVAFVAQCFVAGDDPARLREAMTGDLTGVDSYAAVWLHRFRDGQYLPGRFRPRKPRWTPPASTLVPVEPDGTTAFPPKPLHPKLAATVERALARKAATTDEQTDGHPRLT